MVDVEEGTVKVDFIKGHMGGNQIVLVRGDQVPAGREVDVALSLLGPLSVAGHQVGILYPAASGGDIRVKIVGLATQGVISMCGGLTQVLGKLAIEFEWSDLVKLVVKEPITPLNLETDAGHVGIRIHVSGGQVARVFTDMTTFVRETYQLGVSAISVGLMKAMRVGKFLVLAADELLRWYPHADLEAMPPETKRLLIKLQKDFQAATPPPNTDFAVYDLHPKHGGAARAVYPHDIARGHIEPTCGTGAIAVAMAMAIAGQGPFAACSRPGRVTLELETGGHGGLGGPQTTTVDVGLDGYNLVDAGFSHSVVEIIARGEAWVPGSCLEPRPSEKGRVAP